MGGVRIWDCLFGTGLGTMEVTPKMDPQNVVLKQTINLPTTASFAKMQA